MKKSTILIVVLVYIVSFIIVGFFGIATKGYNPIVYIDDIQIRDPDMGAKLVEHEVSKTVADYYYTLRYEEGVTARLEARLLPDKNSFPEVNYYYDEDNGLYSIEKQEGHYFIISFNPISEGEYTMADFKVISTDGKNLTKSIKILCHNFDA
jgi:hypothetical protein